MVDPFVSPPEPSAEAAIAALREEFALFDDWMDRYQMIIDWGRAAPAFPEAWRDARHRVEGCQSQVWLAAEERAGRIHLAGASDAAIVSGLVAMLLRVYSGRERDEILATGAGFLTELDLIGNLSGPRGNGIGAMVRRITEIARTEG